RGEREEIEAVAEHLAPDAVPLSGLRAEERLRLRLSRREHAREAAVVLIGDRQRRRLLAEEGPEAARRRLERLGRHPVETARTLGTRGDPALVGEDLQVPADGRLRRLQDGAELGDRELVSLDEPEAAEPGGVRQRAHPGEDGRCRGGEINPSIRMKRYRLGATQSSARRT